MQLYSVLVTGANRGIGLQLVKDLLKQNPAHIIATCRNVSSAKELNELASKHPNVHVVQLELTDYARHDSFVAEVEAIVGDKGLTLLIQNAGLTEHDEEKGYQPEKMMKIYEVNAVSPILLTRKLLPLLKKSVASGHRTIASFVGSFLGSVELNTVYKYTAYRMSKSALNNGVRSLAIAPNNESIEFVILHPGHVATDMGSNFGKINAPVTVEESVEGMLKYLENQNLTKDGRVLCWNGTLLPW